MKERTIEETICPDVFELHLENANTKEEYYRVNIVDAQLLKLRCSYLRDNAVTINVDGLDMICLTKEHLETLLGYLKTTEKIYNDER